MIFNCHEILTTACLVIATLARVSGEEGRKSRSINEHVFDQTVQTSRLNSIHVEARDYDRHPADSDNSNYLVRSNVSFPNAIVIASDNHDDTEEFHDEEEKLFAVIMSKDYQVSTPSEIENFDRIGEQMIARANITEEAKRVVRQVKRQRPGFFWTLARVAFETVNETRSAIEQISNLVEGNFIPDTTTLRGGTNAALMTSPTTTQSTTTSATNSTDSMTTTTTTTTEAPFRLTRMGLQTLVRRNLRGLVRLFNIEWRDALNQSQSNVREFQQDLGSRIGPFLEDNPDVV